MQFLKNHKVQLAAAFLVGSGVGAFVMHLKMAPAAPAAPAAT